MQTVVIIGAGPAGLTAAYELLKSNREYKVIILEETDKIGGICRTVNYNGNRMDMGGHRFFSKSERVNRWWQDMLPLQGSKAKDDIMLSRRAKLKKGGPDPEKEDKVMLIRNRVSRIYFNDKFFDYPISLKPQTFKNMGWTATIEAGFSYIKGVVFKKPETNLENFYINRFGKKLYSMFFEYYTENLWGRHPRDISADWGAQRVKGLSILAIIKDIAGKVLQKSNRHVETSLIEEFKYPKLGPGQLWETTADKIRELGGEILLNAKAENFIKRDDCISEITYIKDGERHTVNADYVISSMPVKDLICGLNDTPEDIERIANGLPYRDYMTAGLVLRKFKLKNETNIPTISNIVPDNWIYVQDRHLKLGRMQVYNNWSPYMVNDLENTISVGLEYFCNEGDELWNMDDDSFALFAMKELRRMGCIDKRRDVIDYHVERVKKAYPAYFDTYNEMPKVQKYLDSIKNLYCVGRNGQHRYNNMDHSMETAFETVDCILNNKADKSKIWNVNTESEYHEGESNHC